MSPEKCGNVEEMLKRGFKILAIVTMVEAIGAPCEVGAASVESGKRLAQQQCALCHSVVPGQRREVADAPSFQAIAIKFNINPELLAFEILSPHPKMGFAPSRQEAEDIAVYIRSLAK